MKKIAILSVFCVGLAMVSCKKDRVCSCTTTDVVTTNGSTTTSLSTTKTTVQKIKKGDAKDLCYKNTEITNTTGYSETITSDCKLD